MKALSDLAVCTSTNTRWYLIKVFNIACVLFDEYCAGTLDRILLKHASFFLFVFYWWSGVLLLFLCQCFWWYLGYTFLVFTTSFNLIYLWLLNAHNMLLILNRAETLRHLVYNRIVPMFSFSLNLFIYLTKSSLIIRLVNCSIWRTLMTAASLLTHVNNSSLRWWL